MLSWASSVDAYNNRGKRMTHVIASGKGFLSIADDKHHEFQEQYAMECLGTDMSFALSELPSAGVFPMFFLVIHLDKHGLTEDGMIRISEVVTGVLGRYFSDYEAGSTVLRHKLTCKHCLHNYRNN